MNLRGPIEGHFHLTAIDRQQIIGRRRETYPGTQQPYRPTSAPLPAFG